MINRTQWKNFFNQRLLFVTAFGFFSGLPYALTSSTLQAWMTEAQVNLMTIGLLSLVSFPYTFKFLWAPLLDRFKCGGLSRRRGWILMVQFGMVLALCLMSSLHPASQIMNLSCLALIIAALSATQDVAIDAYRADILQPPKRGLGVAYFIFAYRMAMFASGGLAFVMAAYWGWAHTYQMMAAFMLLGSVLTYYAPEKEIQPQAHPKHSFYLQPFADLWQRENILWILAFVILYKAGAALSVALMTNFLLHELGFTLIQIGLVSKAVIIVGTILGGLVGGYFLMRLGMYVSLLWFGLAQAASILMFMLMALMGKIFPLMVLSLFVENFCSGLSSAALVAFLMSLCNVRYSATQYAFLSAIDTIFRLVAGPLAAALVLRLGWVSFYGWSFAACFPAILILMHIRKRVVFNAEALSLT